MPKKTTVKAAARKCDCGCMCCSSNNGKAKWHHSHMMKGGCGGFYFFGMIGSAVYFIANTSGFWNIVLAILKSFVWPAFAVFHLLKFLGV